MGRGPDGMTDQERQMRSQYAQTPQGQFQRYFQSSEMDPYFGAASRGKGAPENLEAMNALASQRTAPTTSPLATYYRAQSAAGRGNMDEVVAGLTQGRSPEEAKNLTAWAQANPMLAFREYNKRFPGGAGGPSALQRGATSLNVPVETAFNNPAFAKGYEFPGGSTPSFPSKDVSMGQAQPYQMPSLMGGSNQGMDTSQLFGAGTPNMGAFNLPGGAMNQGNLVSAPFKQAADTAAMYTNPMNNSFDFGVNPFTPKEDVQSRTKNFFANLGIR